MSIRSITVEIAGIRLPVRTDVSDVDIEYIASLVNDRFRAVQAGAKAQSFSDQLALVALTLAQQLVATQKAHAALQTDTATIAQSVIAALDAHSHDD